MTKLISFPGLSLGPFEINPVAIDFGSIQIRWYGIFIALGMVLAFLYAAYRAKQSGISADDLLDYVIFAIPAGIIGARAYYVFFDWLERPELYKSFYDVIAFWEGGIAIYGGVIGGLCAMLVVSRVKKEKLLPVLDCVAPGVMLAQACGRWGNFFNGEAYGVLDKIVFPFFEIKTPSFEQNFPLRMIISRQGHAIAAHPTFFYESLWNVIGFFIINAFFKGKRFDGQIVCMYLVWYGFGRFFIEGLRGDSLMFFGLRFSQLVAFLCVVTGIVFLVVGTNKAKKNDKVLDSYVCE